MTTAFPQTAHANLYNEAYLPMPQSSSAAARVGRLRAIAASHHSVGHGLRGMLLARVLFDAEALNPEQEEFSVFEQVLAEGQHAGILWTMDGPAIARALIAATSALLTPDPMRRANYADWLRTATQVVDLLLQGLMRTSLPNFSAA